MHKEHQIIKQVYDAKTDINVADDFIRAYIPFIRKEASKYMNGLCTEQDDEYSISLMAFHEAILSFEKNKGSFLNYAALIIKSRLIDYSRTESRHKGHISIYEESHEDDTALHEKLADTTDPYADYTGLEATKQEIEELKSVMKSFGLSLSDVADNAPKQDRTLEACSRVVNYAKRNPQLLDEVLRTKKLPISNLAKETQVEKKTLERHRKYLLSMLIILTNGYEIIRGHIKHVLKLEGGVSV